MSRPKQEIPKFETEADFESSPDLVMRHKVLVVGPTEIHAKKLEQTLSEFGYDVVWEQDGRSALERLKNDQISLVISEIDMPSMSGPELLAEVRNDQRTERTPLVFLAGDDEKFDHTSLQANDVLIKPFRPQEMRIRIQNLISLAEYERLLLDENRQLSMELLDKNRKLEDGLASLQKAHEDLRTLQAQLVQSAKMASLGILGTGIAHEINNPLAIIVGYNSQLQSLAKKNGPDAEALSKISERIAGSSQRIVRIVDSLRRLSVKQVGAGTESVVIDETLPILVDFFRERANAKGIDIRFELTAQRARIKADPALLRQTLLAIVTNALDAMENSPKRQLLLATRVSKDRVVIVIADSGSGIAPEIRDKIFDPFFTTKDPDKGTGLGLTMAYRAVRDFGGDISFESPPDGGTRFIVSFPKLA